MTVLSLASTIPSRTISRPQISVLTVACLLTLQKHGISPVMLDPQDGLVEQYENLIENVCAYLGLDIEQKPRKGAEPKSSNIDRKALDHITLECALVFAQKIRTDVHHNETLNVIRMMVVKILCKMGYENLYSLCVSPKAHWGCYRAWENVAMAGGMTDGDIKDTRDWCKRHQTELYEESPPVAS